MFNFIIMLGGLAFIYFIAVLIANDAVYNPVVTPIRFSRSHHIPTCWDVVDCDCQFDMDTPTVYDWSYDPELNNNSINRR